MLQFEDTRPKTGQPVLYILRSKQPKACIPTAQSLEAYGVNPLAMVPVDISDATVETVARQLLGSAGPEGVDSISLQYWLMRFGVESLGIQ